MGTVAERKAESIALMLGKTAYRDLRNGFATVPRWVQRRAGLASFP
jgi:hypothetical protein